MTPFRISKTTVMTLGIASTLISINADSRQSCETDNLPVLESMIQRALSHNGNRPNCNEILYQTFNEQDQIYFQTAKPDQSFRNEAGKLVTRDRRIQQSDSGLYEAKYFQKGLESPNQPLELPLEGYGQMSGK